MVLPMWQIEPRHTYNTFAQTIEFGDFFPVILNLAQNKWHDLWVWTIVDIFWKLCDVTVFLLTLPTKLQTVLQKRNISDWKQNFTDYHKQRNSSSHKQHIPGCCRAPYTEYRLLMDTAKWGSFEMQFQKFKSRKINWPAYVRY